VFLEIVPQLPKEELQGESHFLMFRRRVFGHPQEDALYPVDGRIVGGEAGHYQVKIAYPNIQQLLVNFGLDQVIERIGLLVHPT